MERSERWRGLKGGKVWFFDMSVPLLFRRHEGLCLSGGNRLAISAYPTEVGAHQKRCSSNKHLIVSLCIRGKNNPFSFVAKESWHSVKKFVAISGN